MQPGTKKRENDGSSMLAAFDKKVVRGIRNKFIDKPTVGSQCPGGFANRLVRSFQLRRNHEHPPHDKQRVDNQPNQQPPDYAHVGSPLR